MVTEQRVRGRNATYLIDLGGTWLRLTDATGPSPVVTCLPAPSLLRRPDRTVAELRRELVELLCARTPSDAVVAMSCGAAMDETRGIVYGSAPLWGAARDQFRLVDALTERRPDVRWYLVNDLTAGLADFARFAPSTARLIGYLTVSSGIAYRCADFARRTIPVDEWGLQGEVGHLTAPLSDELHPAPRCGCGASGHIGAIASGPGIQQVAATVGLDCGPDFTAGFTERLAARDRLALRVLRVAVAPIAEFLRGLWYTTPQLDLVGLGGGVVENLREFYRAELFRLLAERRSYADRGRDEEWLTRHVKLCAPGEIDSMRGAARMLRGELAVAR
ncbi:ROK family protein [Nocardia arthritidis]|uniref:ROK family protein n=1 Tax=Nocardia arthritidis TaxID=228602 RepID=A0A6G9YEG4_9NOCA|nr:ROK family protein [Nocardia arthritidis]QIS11621.1 ROK family protein [Nocardia arthritidis]